jgi:head-tail adaptor
MSQLSNADLAYMQEAIGELLPGTCYILSGTPTSNGAGEMLDTWGTIGTADCRLDAKTGNEQLQGAAVRPQFSYVLTLPYGTTIEENYRVVVGSDTFNVTSIDAGKSWSACARAYLERT